MFEGFSERMTFMNPLLLKTSLSFVKTRQHLMWINLFCTNGANQIHYLRLLIHSIYVSSSIFNINAKWTNLPFEDFHHCCRKSDMCQSQSDATTTLRPPLSPIFCSSLLKTLDYVKFQQWPLLYRAAQLSLLSFSLWKKFVTNNWPPKDFSAERVK